MWMTRIVICAAVLANAQFTPGQCVCGPARTADQWCSDCGVGFVSAVKIESKRLFETLAGRAAATSVIKCRTCRRARSSDGYCDECRVGYTDGTRYRSKVAHRLARGKAIDRTEIACAECRANVGQSGWCEACEAGIVGNRSYCDKSEYRSAKRARKVLASAARADCESCAVAMVTDGRCEKCRISYEDGRRVRRVSDKVQAILDVLGVRPGQSVADIGCGSGWLSEGVAGAVGPEGKVYAVEIHESHLDRVRAREVPNIVPVLSKPADVSLEPNSLDIAFMHDVASHVNRKSRPDFYASVAGALRPNGRLVIFGPHGNAERMLDALRGYGFVPESGQKLSGLTSRELDAALDRGIRFRYEDASRAAESERESAKRRCDGQ